MRIKISLTSQNTIYLSKGFNANMQALIYNFFNKVDGNWLHSEGYKYEKRKFRLFIFSSILERGQYNKATGMFIFPNRISFYVSSPVNWILEQLAGNILRSEQVQLGNNFLSVNSIEVLRAVNFSNKEIIRAITPIEVHSTLKKEDGKKVTYYYSPFENDYNELINSNLIKKWEALYRKKCKYKIVIKPLFSGNNNERIVYFGTSANKTLIKGWKGRFELTGKPEFLQFAYNAGLGSRNSQGFGMIEVEK
ncbi:CRISPR-associated endoribonuclease Cas6 [candidate division WOR-3 bacterium]|nr:CRISPR-associated endoribonuclease Cas6 [candidate division WOR-3 bacterium]